MKQETTKRSLKNHAKMVKLFKIRAIERMRRVV